MKKNTFRFGAIGSMLLLTLMIAFTGCKKDDDESNTDKLTEKNFKLTAATVDPAVNVGGTLVTDYYSAILQNCSKDDIMRFAKNNTYTVDEGATKCDPTDPQTTTGTWVWNTNETVLTTTEDGDVQSLNVQKNDGTKLIVSFTQVEDGITYTFTATYTKQ